LNNRSTAYPIILGIVSFLFFLLYREHYCVGDSLIYADNILRLRFNDISLHVGYYILGYIFHLFLKPLTLNIDQTMILMSCFFGSVGIIYAYLLISNLLKNSRITICSTFLLFFSGAYLTYSIGAEVYIIQTVFMLASMYHFLRRHSLAAGALFAIAVLVTPLSIFGAGFFVYFFFKRRCRFREFVFFTVAFGIVFLPIFIPFHEEFLWGRRGLLKIGMASSYIHSGQALKNLVLTFAKSFHAFAIILIVGYIYMFSKYREAFWAFTILSACHLYLLFKAQGSDALESFLLPLFFTYSAMITVGLKCILEQVFKKESVRTLGTISLVIVFSIISILIRLGPEKIINPRITPDSSFQKDMRAFDRKMTSQDILITAFSEGVAFTYYTRKDPSEELEATKGNTRWVDIDLLPPQSLRDLFDSRKHIYALESYSPGPGAQLLFSKEKLEERFENYSVKARLKRLDSHILIENLMEGESTHFYKILLNQSKKLSNFQ